MDILRTIKKYNVRFFKKYLLYNQGARLTTIRAVIINISWIFDLFKTTKAFQNYSKYNRAWNTKTVFLDYSVGYFKDYRNNYHESFKDSWTFKNHKHYNRWSSLEDSLVYDHGCFGTISTWIVNLFRTNQTIMLQNFRTIWNMDYQI